MTFVMLGINSHEPLRRLQHHGDYSSLPNDLVSEDTPCITPVSESTLVLPSTYVSLPVFEEGHVTLRPQIVGSAITSEEQPVNQKNWHHKAIRRNLSKAKELVLFVGGLPANLANSKYDSYAAVCAKTDKSSIGPVFPTLGCFFVTFLSGTSAFAAYKCFKEKPFQGTLPELIFLPYIVIPRSAEEQNPNPLLVFINCKSGGGQGKQLHGLMLEMLNENQIFLMDKGGAIPGLFAFRKLPKFRILVCGGDGTVGWVLSHLEIVQRHLLCTSPPMAILPVGTGNDLARVLGFGSGWNGEHIDHYIDQIPDFEPVQLDRWNVMFDSSVHDNLGSPDPLLVSDAVAFRNDVVDGAIKPISPINIVMNIGGTGTGTGTSLIPPPLFHEKGVQSLVSAALPMMVSDLTDVFAERANDDASVNRAISSENVFESNEVKHCDINLIENQNLTPRSNEQQLNSGCELDVWQSRSDFNQTSQSIVDLNQNNQSERKSDLNIPQGDLNLGHQSSDDLNQSKDDLNFNQSQSPKFHRQRSRNSRRHRMVQILSESDLDFGPFIGYEESKADKNCETEDQSDWVETFPKPINFDNPTPLDSPTMPEGNGDVVPDEKGDGIFIDGKAVSYKKLPLRASSENGTLLVQEKETVAFHKTLSLPFSSGGSPVMNPADDVKLIVMSNYFGIGIDAELTLAFHLAREENPGKCTSRVRNKAMYFKAGLKKMTSKSVNLNHVIELEVDNEIIHLPSVRGLIFLNIGSWAGGANAWGSPGSKRFNPPSFGDGLVEIVGVCGVAHMSQIYGGLRNGVRIAQGEYIRMTLKAEVAVQIDGEPWMQPPGKIIISASPQQATMLKKPKKKSK